MCDCIENIDNMLAEHNTKLALSITLGEKSMSLPTIQVEKLNAKVRKGPAAIVPTFCPFCGEKYYQ